MNFEFDLTVTLSLVLAVITILFTWFRTRRHDVDERFQAGTKRMASAEERIHALEITVKGLPAKDDMHELQLQMARMNGHIETLTERLKPIGAMTERMQELLLANKAR